MRLGPRYVELDHNREGKQIQVGPVWWQWAGREEDPGLQERMERVQGVFALEYDEEEEQKEKEKEKENRIRP